MGELVEFSAVHEGKLPEPEDAKPIEEFEFVHVMSPPGGLVV
jgi:hypothetical protein